MEELQEDVDTLDAGDDWGVREVGLSKDVVGQLNPGQPYASDTPLPLFALTVSDPIHGSSPSATLLLQPSHLLPQQPPPLPPSALGDIALDTLRMFFPPSSPFSSTHDLHDHATQPGRRYAFCLSLQHRGGRPLPAGSPARVVCAAPGADLQGPPALLAVGEGEEAQERQVPTSLRSTAEMRKAVVRVEAIYELDAEGRSR